jgi:hypothetical protein
MTIATRAAQHSASRAIISKIGHRNTLRPVVSRELSLDEILKKIERGIAGGH